MEPNIDRMQWSVVAMLAAIVVGGVVLLAFPKISGKIANSMNDTVDSAFDGKQPTWVSSSEDGGTQKDPSDIENLFTYEENPNDENTLYVSGFNDDYVIKYIGVDETFSWRPPLYPTEVELPKTYQGKEVRGVMDYADFDNKKITSVVIPDNYEYIGESSFSDNNIAELVISDGVKEIGNGAFSSSKVEKLTLGNSVEKIGRTAFSGNNITDLAFPDSIEEIGDSAFRRSKNIQSSDPQGGVLKFPNKKVKIGNTAFERSFYKTVYMPGNLDEVGSSIFSLSAVEKAVFQGSPELIPRNVFRGAGNLKEANIPNSVKKIAESAFENTGIVNVHIPSSVREIEKQAFNGARLYNITFDEGVEKIGEKAFFTGWKSSLIDNYNKELKLPHSLKVLEANAFKGIGSERVYEKLWIGDGLEKIGYYAVSTTSKAELYINLQSNDDIKDGVIRGNKPSGIRYDVIVKEYK